MEKKLKKGFTLVELLVVIAILAILATVSVIGYLSFTNRAKQSNDQSLITQINTVLEGNEVVNGKPTELKEVANVIETEIGFDKFVPSDVDSKFVYDSDTNRFTILSNSTFDSTKDASLWLFVNDEATLKAATDNVSVYLTDLYDGQLDLISVQNGFDAGNHLNVKEVTFSTVETGDFTLTTYNSTLNVSADKANVYHYGSAEIINIETVSSDSFHEYGYSKCIYLTSGNLVIENTGYTEFILISAPAYYYWQASVENKTSNAININCTEESNYSSLGSIVTGNFNLYTNYVSDSESLIEALRKTDPVIYLNPGEYVLDSSISIENTNVQIFALNDEATTITFSEKCSGAALFVGSTSSKVEASLKIFANDNFTMQSEIADSIALISVSRCEPIEINGGNYISKDGFCLRTYQISDVIAENATFTALTEDVTNESVLSLTPYTENVTLKNVTATSNCGGLEVLSISEDVTVYIDGGYYAKPEAIVGMFSSYPSTVSLMGKIVCSNNPTFVYNGTVGDKESCFSDMYDYNGEQVGFITGEYTAIAAGVAQ